LWKILALAIFLLAFFSGYVMKETLIVLQSVTKRTGIHSRPNYVTGLREFMSVAHQL